MIGAIIGGIVAGWAAGKLINGKGFGCWWDLVIGLIGGVVGGLIFKLIFEQAHISTEDSWLLGGNWIGETVTAIIGASLLVWIVKLVKK